MQIQILDADYILLKGKPLLRIFGKTNTGDTVCAFYDKYLPYFYVQSDDLQTASQKLKEMFSNEITEIQTIEKTLPFGFNAPVKVLKVIGRDPSKVPEMKEFVSQYGTPYEADILFRYRFMVDNKLKGMSWAEVDGNIVNTDTVKCRAINATSITPIELIDNAPLRHMAIDIECVANGAPVPEKDQIIMISIKFSPSNKGQESLVIVAKSTGGEGIIGCQNEEDMLKRFSDILKDYDPDILLGYNINNYDLPHILARLQHFDLPRDLGRTEKTAFVKKIQGRNAISLIGRVVVDPYEILKRDPWVKFKRYDLGTIAREFLGSEKLDVGGMQGIKAAWSGSQEELRRLIEYARRDSDLAMKFVTEKSMLDKFIELSKISGALLQDTFGGQSQRLECKLLHTFRDMNVIMPCKPNEKELLRRNTEREKLGLKGAIVIDPVVGLHTGGCVAVLDFKSLYPSIISAYNICPTTLVYDKSSTVDVIESPVGSRFVKPQVRMGVLPVIVKEFMDTRAAVKKAAKYEVDKEKRRILNAKQLAIKDISNSLYGYTGYVRSRLYVFDVASSITAIGRDNIVKTRNLIEKEFDVKVLYADTDSTFIKTDLTDLDAVQQFGEKVAAYVTTKMSGLELQYEKLYKTFLILSKKRYAGWMFEKVPTSNGAFEWRDKIEMKGIETVRRDWCILTSDTMVEVLNILLKEQDVKKAIAYVRTVAKDLGQGKVSLEKLTVVKGVTKSLESYYGIQPHVELAKKIMERDPTRGSMIGERLGYVIIKGNSLLSKRAEDPLYVQEKGLQIDSSYYIENQLLPPLLRIFDTLGIEKTELLEGLRQKSLSEMLNGKILMPEKTILSSFDRVACSSCNWNFHRPSLSGVCPQCGSQIYFAQGGTLGKFLKMP